MKLLHVIGSMNPQAGGPCQGIRNLAPCVFEQGHTVEVVCLDDPNSEYLSQEKLRIHALGKGSGPWGYQPRLKAWLNKHLSNFDAVIVNGLWQYQGYILSKIARRAGMPPYFIFPHGMLDPWFQRARERRLKAIRNWFYWKLIEQNNIRKAEAVFFTCEEELRLARQTFRPYHPKRQINVRFGVPQPPEYQETMQEAFLQKCPGTKGRPYFLFLGRIHPKKGMDILIKAYSAIYHASRTNGQPSFPNLVIAGPGLESDFGRAMQALASSICPPNSVLWPGMLTGGAKLGALYNSEAFVLTSHQENFGIAVVEALACGTPVLISNQVNIWPEIAEDNAGLTGDDTLEGAEDMFRRWKDLSPEDKALMKTSARSSFEKRFRIASVARHLMAAIEEFRMRTPVQKA